jgi:hypothetical protein
MKAGRLSYTVGPDGARLLDPSELERIYDIQPNATPAPDAPTVAWNKSQQVEAVAQLAAERAKTAMLEARFADAQDQISDLRTRLDASEAERRTNDEERRRTQAQLNALQTDQRPAKETATPTRAWGRFLTWRRGRGWSILSQTRAGIGAGNFGRPSPSSCSPGP